MTEEQKQRKNDILIKLSDTIAEISYQIDNNKEKLEIFTDDYSEYLRNKEEYKELENFEEPEDVEEREMIKKDIGKFESAENQEFRKKTEKELFEFFEQVIQQAEALKERYEEYVENNAKK